MKSRIFIVLLLTILINSIVHAEEYSFDPETRILSTPYFSMELSDYWGPDYKFYLNNFFTISNDANDVSLSFCHFHDKEYSSREEAGDALEAFLDNTDDILIEYDKYEFLDGYLKELYALDESITVLIEGYSFVPYNSKSVGIFIMVNRNGDNIDTSKQTFKSDLETITSNDSQKVMINPSFGTKYHKHNHGQTEYVTISLEEAIAKGYTPCQLCYINY